MRSSIPSRARAARPALRWAWLVLAGLTVSACASANGADAPATTTAASAAPVTTAAAADDPIAFSATTAPEPTTTTAAPPPSTAPTTTTIALPIPEPPPADAHAAEPDVVLGTLEIARLNLKTQFRAGVTLTTIDKGPGWWPGTAMPGQIGNVVIAGHRVTHTKPFRHLDTLQVGDQAVFTLNDGTRVVYAVTGNEVVVPTNIGIITQTPAHTLTLFACHPPGSARFRFVVHLAQVDPPVPDPAAANPSAPTTAVAA